MSRPACLKEIRQTLTLAFPIIIGQVSQMLMGVTDAVMIGRVGKVPLAAAAFTHGLFMLVFIVAIGVLMSVSVLVARAHGARQARECASLLQHGMMLGIGLGALGMLTMFATVPWLSHFGQPPEVVAEVRPYFELIALSLIPTLVFQVLRQFSEAVDHPWAPMGILLGGVGLNVVLNWILIYGNLGAPALGLAGAGWATFVARVLAAGLLWWWLARRSEIRTEWPSAVLSNSWLTRLTWARLRAMFRIGVPAAIYLLFEVGAFSAAALMMGLLGTVELAAHHIALTCAGFTFMFPLGISIAVSVRIGRAVGEGRFAALRKIGLGALGAGSLIMLGCALVFLLAGRQLVAGFSTELEVTALAAQLLVVAAVFQLFDGAQVIASGALRGMTDVKVPMVITFIAYWLIALPGGYWLGVRGAYGPLGIWAALATGLAAAALLLTWRFYHKTTSSHLSPIG